MKRYFDIKVKEARTKETIMEQINQVAKNHNTQVNVQFYSSSMCISTVHFMTTLHSDGSRDIDKLCGGKLPETLEGKIEAVTKMHQAEQEHNIVLDAILKVLS